MNTDNLENALNGWSYISDRRLLERGGLVKKDKKDYSCTVNSCGHRNSRRVVFHSRGIVFQHIFGFNN